MKPLLEQARSLSNKPDRLWYTGDVGMVKCRRKEVCAVIDPKKFQDSLLAWYRKESRDLPWRRDPSPYNVWISEMMLQQTRVDTVIPYFTRFLTEIPDVRALAGVPDDKLMKCWQGLGYYRRAQNLKKAAQRILERFDGKIPSSLQDLRTLPGIGAYSAGAIASIAFGVRTCAVDGNVLRVMARLSAYSGSLSDPAAKKRMTEITEALLPENGAGDFNQALMDLGATVCLPNGEPRCPVCPVREMCEVRAKDLVASIPAKEKTKARRIEKRTIFIILCTDRVALRRRGPEGLLADLWEFPNEEGFLSAKKAEKILRQWDVEPLQITPAGEARHIFSHLEWRMKSFLVLARGNGASPAPYGLVFASLQELRQNYSVPTAFRFFLKQAVSRLEGTACPGSAEKL